MKVIICDKCKKEKAKPSTFITGRSMDAAGSYSDDTVIYDLCLQCKVDLFWGFINQKGITQELAEYIEKRMKDF